MSESAVARRPCQNCGAELNGRYCANCGQTADVRIASMSELISDLLEDFSSLDSRIWRSLVLLVLKPGHLTADYLAGRRVRYIPPFRMYLVTSLTFFAVGSLLEDEIGIRGGAEGPGRPPTAEMQQDLREARQELRNFVERVAPQSEFAGPDDPATANVDASVGSAVTERSAMEVCEQLEGGLSPTWSPLIEACKNVAAAGGPQSLFTALRENVPMMMLLFMPLVALLMKLLYPLEKRKYVEHLLFFLHFHAFFFLLMSVGVLLDVPTRYVPALASPIGLLSTVGAIYLPIYLFLAMQTVYRQGGIATSMKYVLLLIGYGVTLALSFLVTLGYTAINL